MLHSGSLTDFALDAGGEQIIEVNITEQPKFDSKIHVFVMASDEGRPEKYTMHAIGVVQYTYETVVGRKTGFSRKLDPHTHRFIPSITPDDDEYQD